VAVRVVTASGRRAGLPGKGTPIYTVGKYGGMLFDDYPMGMIAYRSTDQTVAASTWANVTLDTLVYTPSSYGLCNVQISNGGLLFATGGKFLVTANIKFNPIGGSATVHHRFRIEPLLSFGDYYAGNVTYAPNQFDWVLGGSGVILDTPAGNGFILQVSHTYSGSLTLLGGVASACINVGRIPG
jgi:hypothetical protein